MEVIKEKNLIKFYIEGKARPYILDVNKGVIYGLRGIEIQEIPPAICKSPLGVERTSVLNLVRERYSPRQNKALYSLADRLDAVGYTAGAYELYQVKNNIEDIEVRDFVKYRQEHEDATLRAYIDEYMKIKWAIGKGLKIDEHFTPQMASFLYEFYKNQSNEVLSVFAYYLSRGLWEFCRDRWEIHSHLDSFLTYMHALDWKMEKTDFYRAYVNAKRAYNINRDALRDKGIKNYQMEHIKALTFEDDTFTVVIPTTDKELVAEGEKQHNCVGGYGNSIIERRKNVVFIRYKAKPDVPFITCDIVDTGHINQYLTKYNRREYGDDAREFYHAFQKHLLENWGK